MSVIPVALAGLAAGSVHVVSGPDHLAAVLPLAVESRAKAARVGAWWGVGHGAGVLALGALGQVFKDSIDIEAVSGFSELAVGGLLVALGVWAIHRSRALVVHTHGHDHGDANDHEHPHVHIGDDTVGTAAHPTRGRHATHRHSALGFGLLHGTAGAGHLFGVLPSLMLGPGAAALYLCCYFVAAVLAMTVFAGATGLLVGKAGSLPLAMRLSGVVTIVVGCVWVGAAL